MLQSDCGIKQEHLEFPHGWKMGFVGRNGGLVFGLRCSWGEGSEAAELRGSSARCLTVFQAGFNILYQITSLRGGLRVRNLTGASKEYDKIRWRNSNN